MQITTKTFSILLRRIDFSCIDVFGLAYCQPNFELFSPGRCWGALKYLHAAGPYPVANLSQFADPTTTISFRLDLGLDYWLAKPLHWFFFRRIMFVSILRDDRVHCRVEILRHSDAEPALACLAITFPLKCPRIRIGWGVHRIF